MQNLFHIIVILPSFQAVGFHSRVSCFSFCLAFILMLRFLVPPRAQALPLFAESAPLVSMRLLTVYAWLASTPHWRPLLSATLGPAVAALAELSESRTIAGNGDEQAMVTAACQLRALLEQ